MIRPPPPELDLPSDVALQGDLSSVIGKWADDHGPIFGMRPSSGPWVGRRPVYLVGQKANRFVLKTHDRHFSREFGWRPILGDRFGKGLINIDDPDDRPIRAALASAFTSERVVDYLPAIESSVAARTAHWRRGTEVDVLSATTNIAFDVAAAVLLGISPGSQADELRQCLDTVMNTSRTPGGTVDSDKQQVAKTQLYRTLGMILEARRDSRTSNGPALAIDLLTSCRDKPDPAVTNSQLLSHLSVLLVAGYETTTTLGAWLLYELSTHLSCGDAVDAEGQLRSALEKMPILENAIRETGRLHPPVVFLPRVALSDLTFEGYTFPAGTPVFLAVGGGHHMESVFPDADSFRPQRFGRPSQGGNGQVQGLTTFGGGRRTCLGARLAVAELKLLVTHIRKNYELSPVSSRPPKTVESIVQWLPQGIIMQIR
jgi:cytochrome P450